MRTGLGCGNSCSACVGEEVQDLDRAVGFLNKRREPVPVGSLLREKTCVLKTEGLKIKCQFFIINSPFFRKLVKLPLSAALVTAVIVAVWFFPAKMFFFRYSI